MDYLKTPQTQAVNLQRLNNEEITQERYDLNEEEDGDVYGYMEYTIHPQTPEENLARLNDGQITQEQYDLNDREGGDVFMRRRRSFGYYSPPTPTHKTKLALGEFVSLFNAPEYGKIKALRNTDETFDQLWDIAFIDSNVDLGRQSVMDVMAAILSATSPSILDQFRHDAIMLGLPL